MLNTATATSAAASGSNHHSSIPAEMPDPSPSSSAGPIRIDGSEHDAALSKSEFLTRPEVINRRARRVKQLARIYRDHYWALMEELKLKYRDYCWEYGKSPFVEDEENDKINPSLADGAGLAADNGNVNLGFHGGNASIRCNMNNCKVKAMALTRFCHMHILNDTKQVLYRGCSFAIKSVVCKEKAMALTRFCHMHILNDTKQVLYRGCSFAIKSSTTGPITCSKPILATTVPAYCAVHFQKAEKHMVRALKKSGLNITSTSKLAPKLHVIVAEYVRQIQQKRRAIKRENMEKAVVRVENNNP